MSGFYDVKLNTIFVHVPRCGGSSISAAFQVDYWVPETEIDINQIKPTVYRLGRFHWPARRMQDELGILFDQAFSFAFVRNPWSWMASRFFRAKARPYHPLHESATKGFEYFVSMTLERDPRDQWGFFTKNGKIIVSHVGIFEQFGLEMKVILKRLGVFVDIPTINSSYARASDYREMYSAELANKVGDRFQREILYFGYCFDKPNEFYDDFRIA